MKINQCTPGQIVYSVERRQMGNTALRTTSVFSVYIREVDPEGKWVMASWNGNPARKFYSAAVSKWKKEKPLLVGNMRTGYRLATKEEIKQRGEEQSCL